MKTVSVILPVYNGCNYIRQTIGSILSQEFKDFELIIVDDGSTDKTRQAIGEFTDERIIYYYQENSGASSAINSGIKKAKGEFIAHCDADDIWAKDKLSRQMKAMIQRPEIVLSGTWASIINDKGEKIGEHNHAYENNKIKIELMFRNPFVHSSLMYRKQAAIEVGLYSTDETLTPPEDYEFITRMAGIGSLMNIKERLVLYRHHSEGLSKLKHDIIERNAIAIATQYINSTTVLPLDDQTTSTAMFYRGQGNLSQIKRLIPCLKDSISIWNSSLVATKEAKLNYITLMIFAGIKTIRNSLRIRVG